MPGGLTETGAGGGAADDLDVGAATFRTGRDPRRVPLARGEAAGGMPRIETIVVTADDGAELFEGDIDITPPEQTEEELQRFGLTIRSGGGTWPAGVIPYVTQDAVRPQVEAAAAHWRARTSIRLVAWTGQRDYVSFEDRGRCRSKIGRVGGPQLVELSRGCSTGDAIHEIGHVVGLWHEQSRTDRGAHVQILLENVDPSQRDQFEVHDGSAVNRGAYDIQSCMHYPSTAFSANGRPTILTLTGQPIPPRSGLSAGDLAAVQALYPG